MLLNGRRAHFLEVFLPNLSSNRLKVPPKFAHHLGDQTSASFTLIGPSGNQWHIHLFEYDGHFFFREGWPTFVKDHDIQCGDTLVFGYDGDSTFTVQIFDESSCEKDEAFSVNCSQRNCSHGADEFNEVLGKRIGRDNEDLKLELVAEKKMRSSCSFAPRVLPTQKRVHNLKKCAKKKKKLKKTVAVNVTSKKFLGNNQDKQKTDNQKAPNVLKFIEARVALYFKSTNPYFVRVMHNTNLSGRLKIPPRFSSLHLPNCRVKITLMNLNGDCWIVNSIPDTRYTTYVHSICGGWRAFVRDNNIKIEDVCIFKLVGELELCVHILRMGLKELERQLRSQSRIDADGVELGERGLETIITVAGDTAVNPSKDLDEMNVCEADIQHKVASFIDTDDYFTSDELHLERDGGGTMAYQTSGNKERNLQSAHLKPLVEEARDALSYTSPFPNFMKVMTSSHVCGKTLTLSIPREFSDLHLPSYNSQAILRNLRGDSWNVAVVRHRNLMRLTRGWGSFVHMNKVKLGDVCVFELLGERELQVRILGGS